MATSEAKEIKKQETLVRFSIISYNTRLRVLFLSEAVEASRCNFFENWLMKHKYPHLLKPLGTINQTKYWSFYPSEPI